MLYIEHRLPMDGNEEGNIEVFWIDQFKIIETMTEIKNISYK